MQFSNYFVAILVLCLSFCVALPNRSSKNCSKLHNGRCHHTPASSEVPSMSLVDSPSSDSSSGSTSGSTSGTGKPLLSSNAEVTGTYYYANNADGKSPCGEDLSVVATEPTLCEPSTGYKPLNAYGNNIVAMASKMLSGDKAKYCGKEVQVMVDGEQIYPADGGKFFIWDGCVACNNDNHLDFSILSLQNIPNQDVCQQGMAKNLTWTIVDNNVKDYAA